MRAADARAGLGLLWSLQHLIAATSSVQVEKMKKEV